MYAALDRHNVGAIDNSRLPPPAVGELHTDEVLAPGQGP